jgi:hypothetical protein
VYPSADIVMPQITLPIALSSSEETSF